MSLAEPCREVLIHAPDALLRADLVLPDESRGLVVFVHGSGSSRKSGRNLKVAADLARRGLATLLFDLLTAEEARRDAVDARLRFDIAFLAERLVGVTDWLDAQAWATARALGYFGASTGAAAALVAAAARPTRVAAVVSRGGRPDLAWGDLALVRAPTLLIVGAADHDVLELNRTALRELRCPSELAVVAGATHLFEEPGALRAVSALAGDWFERHLRVVPRAAEPERSHQGEHTE